jgi:hypothetical protein
MLNIKYDLKSTNANCQYVFISDEDMKEIIYRATIILAFYSELTADKKSLFVATDADESLCGKRGKTSVAQFKPNTRLSLLGGLIGNYYNKDRLFKNDLSLSQLPFIENVLNECFDQFNFDQIQFTVRIL